VWLKLSSHLHLSLKKCKRETTFFEFLQWLQFFEEEEKEKYERVEKEDFYLAQIAAMVVASNAKDPNKIKISDFYMKMKKNQEVKKLTREERAKIAKSFWMQIPSRKGKLKGQK